MLDLWFECLFSYDKISYFFMPAAEASGGFVYYNVTVAAPAESCWDEFTTSVASWAIAASSSRIIFLKVSARAACAGLGVPSRSVAGVLNSL